MNKTAITTLTTLALGAALGIVLYQAGVFNFKKH